VPRRLHPWCCRGSRSLAGGDDFVVDRGSSLSYHANLAAHAAATVDVVSEVKWLSCVSLVIGVICLLVAGTALGLALIREGGIGAGDPDGDWVVAGGGTVIGAALLILGVAKS
jgi:hypothetical protein